MNEKEFLFFEKLGKNILKYRKDLSLTQKQLGEKIGLKQQVIANYEIGRRRIPVFTLIKISKALFVDVIDLLPLNNKTKKRGPSPKIKRDLENIYSLSSEKQKLVSELITTLLKED